MVKFSNSCCRAFMSEGVCGLDDGLEDGLEDDRDADLDTDLLLLRET